MEQARQHADRSREVTRAIREPSRVGLVKEADAITGDASAWGPNVHLLMYWFIAVRLSMSVVRTQRGCSASPLARRRHYYSR